MPNAPDRTAMPGAALSWPERASAPLHDFDSRARSMQRLIACVVATWPLLAPAFVAIAAALLSSLTRLDLQLADALYAWQGGAWSWRTAFLAEQVLHVAARDASAIAWIAVVAALAAACSDGRWRAWRRPLAWMQVRTGVCARDPDLFTGCTAQNVRYNRRRT
jgi:hypothetical protein